MRIHEVIEMLNAIRADGVVDSYAVGGAVGATFYLEPIATIDVDVFIQMQPEPGKLILDPQPLFRYLADRGCQMEGEYVMIGGWPVQFLAPPSPLVEEALSRPAVVDVEGIPTSVLTAEYLAAIALQTGRAKDKLRLLQFIENGVLDSRVFEDIVARHGLEDAWNKFQRDMVENQ